VENRGALLGPRGVAAVYALLAVSVLVPVLSVRVPCLGDTLNHMARIHILTSIDGSPALQRYYERNWRLVPYYGMDVPVALLSRVVGIYAAGRLFVALCVVMPVLAAASLQYAVRRSVGLVPAFAFLVSYNYLLARGFLAYLFSAGLAVMLFAAWVGTQPWPRWRRSALFAAAALLLYFCHVFAFVAYGILLGGYELGRAARPRGRPIAAALADLAAAAAQALPVFATVLLLRADGTFGTVNVTRYGSVAAKLGAMLSPLFFPGNPAVIAACVLLPLAGAAAALLTRRVRLAPGMWPASAFVSLVAICVPSVLFNLWGADFRVPLIAAILLVGVVVPAANLRRGVPFVALGGLAALVLARSADALVTLRALDAQAAQVRQVLAKLPVGARLLVVDADDAAPLRVAPAVVTGHLGMLAVIDRDAFVPFLFTGATPVETRPSMHGSASPNAAAITLAQLQDGFTRTDPASGPPPFGYGGTMYWLGWPQKFDSVLFTHFGAATESLPPVLRRVAHTDVVDLYQIAGHETNGDARIRR
jgi:hypothetical protein